MKPIELKEDTVEKPVFSAEEEASLAEAMEKGLKEEAENFRTPPPTPGVSQDEDHYRSGLTILTGKKLFGPEAK